jgi:hypothetical protein
VLDLLQLYAEQSEDIKKVVDFALERNGARRRNITIAGNLPIFGTTAPITAADDPCKSHKHLVLAGSQPADARATTTPRFVEDEAETKEGKVITEPKEMSKRRAKEEARRERSDKKTAAAADKKEKKRLAREDKEREKERRREEKRARRIARRTKEDERKALKKQSSRENKVGASSSSATTTTT